MEGECARWDVWEGEWPRWNRGDRERDRERTGLGRLSAVGPEKDKNTPTTSVSDI